MGRRKSGFYAIAFIIISSALYQISGRELPVYGYTVINEFPHDTMAFTQGLIYKDGFMYEGTGLYGRSSLRKVEFETGTILKIHSLEGDLFGEGVTIYNDTIIQLTWRNNLGLVYIEQDSFEVIDSFAYPTEGWGLTHDSAYLIMSDGSNIIHFLDPHTYQEVYFIEVLAEGNPVTRLNELEYIQGKIYANVWYSDSIAIIDPQTGNVISWLNLKGILGAKETGKTPNVLNGISFDEENIRLFVTGKLWPTLFEIDVIPLNYPPVIISHSPASPCTIKIDSILPLIVDAEDPDPEDTLDYIWRINGEIDTTAHDTIYLYSSNHITVDTVMVEVTDGMYSDSVSWEIHVTQGGITNEYTVPKIGKAMLQNYPNPFTKMTSITYAVPENDHVLLTIYDANGRVVKTLVDENKNSGIYTTNLDADEFKAGIYFMRFELKDMTKIRKLIVIK